MFKDYIIIDNALRDPDHYVNLSKQINYFYSEKSVSENDVKLESPFSQIPHGGWRGYRSKLLHEIDESLFQKTFNEIFFKLFENFKFNYEYLVQSHLHFFPETIETKSTWHKDQSTIFAGVIYLNKNPPKSSGTTLRINNEEVEVDNVYNRLVVYNSQIEHTPTRPFGKKIDDMRLTLTFFVDKLNIYAENS